MGHEGFDLKKKALIRMLIYPVQFDRHPIESVSRVISQLLQSGRTDIDAPGLLAAIEAALASPEPLAELIPQGHSEATLRTYLAAVRLCLQDRLKRAD